MSVTTPKTSSPLPTVRPEWEFFYLESPGTGITTPSTPATTITGSSTTRSTTVTSHHYQDIDTESHEEWEDCPDADDSNHMAHRRPRCLPRRVSTLDLKASLVCMTKLKNRPKIPSLSALKSLVSHHVLPAIKMALDKKRTFKQVAVKSENHWRCETPCYRLRRSPRSPRSWVRAVGIFAKRKGWKKGMGMKNASSPELKKTVTWKMEKGKMTKIRVPVVRWKVLRKLAGLLGEMVQEKFGMKQRSRIKPKRVGGTFCKGQRARAGRRKIVYNRGFVGIR